MIRYFCPEHAPEGAVRTREQGVEKDTCEACGSWGFHVTRYETKEHKPVN